MIANHGLASTATRELPRHGQIPLRGVQLHAGPLQGAGRLAFHEDVNPRTRWRDLRVGVEVIQISPAQAPISPLSGSL